MRSLPLLTILAVLSPQALPAVELPVTAVTIFPDGALIERRGVLPPGEAVVTGLPGDLDADRLAVAVSGLDQPRWRLRTDSPPADDPDARRLREATAALSAAEAAVARARQRRELAALVTTEVPLDPSRPVPALPTPEDQQALTRFVQANADRAQADLLAAEQQREAAATALAALQARPPKPPPQCRLELPGAAGHAVTIQVRVPQIRWAPRYRVEVVGSAATLVVGAAIQDDRGEAWGSPALTLATRTGEDRLRLPELAIPTLGAAESVGNVVTPREPVAGEMMGFRSGSSKRVSVMRTGGSKASESVVSNHLRFLANQQHDDGSLGDAPHQVATTSLAVLAWMGAGYDHLTLNKFRNQVQKSVDWLKAQDAKSLNLAELALVTAALGESLGISQDSALKAPTQQLLQTLTDRAGEELPATIRRQGAFLGPAALVWTVMAAKSCMASGSWDAGRLYALCKTNLALLPRGPGDDLGWSANALSRIYLGEKFTVAGEDQDRLQSRIRALYRAGELETLAFTNLAMFQLSGKMWQRWHAAYRDFIIGEQQRNGDQDGLWTAPYPAGPVAGSALITLSLEVYYRYARLGDLYSVTPDLRDLPEPPESLGDVQAQGWPIRWNVPTQTGGPQRSAVEIQRIPLGSAVRWQAIPVQDARVWRVLVTTNPLPGPLPPGPCRLVLDGVDAGTAALPFTVPGADLRLPLGADDRLRVERIPGTGSEDGWRKRELAVTLDYRLQAPAGWKEPVHVVEPLPRVWTTPTSV